MPSQSKYDMVDKVAQSIDASNGVFVVDYRGLSVKETQTLRRQLREAGAEMKVYKNNIVKIALKNAEMPEIDELLVGPCAYVFYQNDPVETAKALKKAASSLGKLEFIGGIADGKAVSADEVKALADLPSREELIAKAIGCLANPMSGLVRVLNGPAQGLVTALHAVHDQKDAA